MDDQISRDSVYATVLAMYVRCDGDIDGYRDLMCESILMLPTIEPKRGKWLETDSREPCWYKCDQCGRLHDFLDNYCPNCGARMEI